MDDRGNNNHGTVPNEREASFPRSKQQTRLQLQREFQNITLNWLKWTREEAENPLRVQVVRENGGVRRNQQRWMELFKAIIKLIGAGAMLVSLFETMKYSRSNYYMREREDEEDEDEDEDEDEITTIIDIFSEITGTETVLNILKTLRNKEVATLTMNINTAILLAIKKNNERVLKLDGIYYLLKLKQRMIQSYRMLFEVTVRGNINYNANIDHPVETGIVSIFSIFKDEDNDTANDTPPTLFQKACNGLGRNTALQILEDILQRSSRKINTVYALLMVATLNSNHHDQATVVHLDCSYVLLRRQPDVLLNLLPSSSSSSSSGVSNDSSSCNIKINDDDGDYCDR